MKTVYSVDGRSFGSLAYTMCKLQKRGFSVGDKAEIFQATLARGVRTDGFVLYEVRDVRDIHEIEITID